MNERLSGSQRTIQVDGLVGGADLFADEVVMALGGDPSAGLKLSDRLLAKGIAADVLVMSPFRRSNVELHLRQLQDIAQARRQAELAAEAAEAAAGSAGTAAVPPVSSGRLAPPASPGNTTPPATAKP